MLMHAIADGVFTNSVKQSTQKIVSRRPQKQNKEILAAPRNRTCINIASGFLAGCSTHSIPLSCIICGTVVFVFIQELFNYFDSSVYGIGIPGTTMVGVTVTTIVTTLRLRKAAAWRSESSSGSLSSREVALTKMLIGSSILFIICVSPTALFRFGRKIFSYIVQL